MLLERSRLALNHRLCRSDPSRSRISSKHGASGSRTALLATMTTCAVCELRSTTHLQVACEAQVSLVRVAGDSSIGQCLPHHGGDAVDQGMLHAAVRNVNHAVAAEFEQSPVWASLNGLGWPAARGAETRPV